VRPEDKMLLIYKMAALLFYHSPIFSLIMKVGLRIGNWGETLVSLAASCWQGALYEAGSSGSCGVLYGAFTAVFLGVFGEVDIPGGTIG
jgi:hypothetical protein